VHHEAGRRAVEGRPVAPPSVGGSRAGAVDQVVDAVFVEVLEGVVVAAEVEGHVVPLEQRLQRLFQDIPVHPVRQDGEVAGDDQEVRAGVPQGLLQPEELLAAPQEELRRERRRGAARDQRDRIHENDLEGGVGGEGDELGVVAGRHVPPSVLARVQDLRLGVLEVVVVAEHRVEADGRGQAGGELLLEHLLPERVVGPRHASLVKVVSQEQHERRPHPLRPGSSLIGDAVEGGTQLPPVPQAEKGGHVTQTIFFFSRGMEAALQKLGLERLKARQEEVVRCLLEGRDVLCCLPTGYGKSVCYQVPYLVSSKSAVVVSPLISLMEDQKRKLVERGVPSFCYHSGSEDRLAEGVEGFEEAGCSGVLPSGVLFFSPESARKHRATIVAGAREVSVVAVDESHCICTTAAYRPVYLELGLLTSPLRRAGVPTLALTASCTAGSRRKIFETLGLDARSTVEVVESPFRTNLSVRVTSTFCEEPAEAGKTIVYTRTVADAEALHQKLPGSAIYHGRLSVEQKKLNQERFRAGEASLMVCTNSFGMGIDVPDVRKVVHFGKPLDIEAYYQEIGRAGRDGEESRCVLVLRPRDAFLDRQFSADISDKVLREEQLARNAEMNRYLQTSQCRMVFLARYFCPDAPAEPCGKCDNCEREGPEREQQGPEVGQQEGPEEEQGEPAKRRRPTVVEELVLRGAREVGNCCGEATLLAYLHGSEDKRRIKAWMKKLKHYGVFQKQKKASTKTVVEVMVRDGLLVREPKTSSAGVRYEALKAV